MNKNSGFIFITCFVSYTAIYIARLNLSMASPALKAEQILDPGRIGLLGSVFSVIYALGRLLNGRLSDFKRPRLMITGGLCLTTAGNLCFSFLPPYPALLIFWGMNAFGQSMLWGSILCTMIAVYPPDRARKMSILMAVTIPLGNILAIPVNLYAISAFGVRYAFFIPAVITTICAAAAFFSLKNVPASAAPEGRIGTVPRSVFSNFSLLKNKSVRLAVFPVIIDGIIKENISLWMALYFFEEFHIDMEASSVFILFIPLCGLIGRLLYEPVLKLLGRNEHRVSQIWFIICFVCSIVLCLTQTPLTAMICLSVCCAGASQINTSFLTIFSMRFAASGDVAGVSGIMDLCAYLGAGVASVVYGTLIGSLGYHAMFASWALLSIPAALILQTAIKRSKQ